MNLCDFLRSVLEISSCSCYVFSFKRYERNERAFYKWKRFLLCGKGTPGGAALRGGFRLTEDGTAQNTGGAG